jgi:ribosomal protein S11
LANKYNAARRPIDLEYYKKKWVLHKNILRSQINIVFQRRNTFINLSSENKLLATISAGTLGYIGREKGSPIVRQFLGEEIAAYAVKSHYRLVDINFVAKIGKFYRFVLKGLAQRGMLIRVLRIRQSHPHSVVRPRKLRRI